MSDVLPPVTIGLPFFNAERTLLDAVRSVFAQTHACWELILIDDGSKDRSLEIARSIDDPRVRVYSDGCNRRLASRLNQIARLARFDYIARMDADDLMSRDRIERQLSVIVQNAEVDLVSAGVVSVSDGWVPIGMRCVPDGHTVTARAVLAGRSGIVHAAVLGRRAWFLRNPYDETLRVSQDTNLWIRAYGNGDLNARVLDAPLYFYREDGNVTYTKLKEAYRVQRRTIISQSAGFHMVDRAAAYTIAGIKSSVAFALNTLGRMDVLRQRRNAMPLTSARRSSLRREIDAIRATPLPMRSAARPCHGD
jgi:glycosyltransferase involved in cell wall biosynthesis